MEIQNSKYKSKIDKIKGIGIKKENNLSTEDAFEALLKILNATILKKKPVADISIYQIERMLQSIKKKHEMYIGYIMPVNPDDERIHYSFSLRFRNEHIDTVFARNIFEGFAKSLLVLYYYIKLQEDTKDE